MLPKTDTGSGFGARTTGLYWVAAFNVYKSGLANFLPRFIGILLKNLCDFYNPDKKKAIFARNIYSFHLNNKLALIKYLISQIFYITKF